MKPLESLYPEAIRRHAAEPVGYRRPIRATHVCELDNPQCGDRVEMRLRSVHGVIEDAAFEGEACAICLASASLLCELARGLHVDEFGELHLGLEAALKGEMGGKRSSAAASPGEAGTHEMLAPLLGVRPYPSRVDCALLPWKAARLALQAPGAD